MEIQIEKSLKEKWEVSSEVPLILDAQLKHLLCDEVKWEDGTKHRYQGVRLYHKGDRYILKWWRWDQTVSERTPLEDEKGNHSNGSTSFQAGIEAVYAGFSHILTVNEATSKIKIWKKKEDKE